MIRTLARCSWLVGDTEVSTQRDTNSRMPLIMHLVFQASKKRSANYTIMLSR